ncbi:MAG: DUF6164 family protein [Gammaproteobacteria bacterium]|nr:DUF6164 family protein [Gammaproteobacteria bacterium]
MTVLLIKLRGVPDDEAEELRDLLTTNKIDHYETSAGNWGISMPAIWLNDSNQLQKAKLLIEEYQAERFARARDEYEQLKKEGKHRTILDEVKENPIRIVAYLAIIAVVIYFSTKPFIDVGK